MLGVIVLWALLQTLVPPSVAAERPYLYTVPGVKLATLYPKPEPKAGFDGFYRLSATATDSDGKPVPFCVATCPHCATILKKFHRFWILASPAGARFDVHPRRTLLVDLSCDHQANEPRPLVDESGLLWGFVAWAQKSSELSLHIRVPQNVFGTAEGTRVRLSIGEASEGVFLTQK